LKLQVTIDGKAYEVEVEILEEDANPSPPASVPHHPVHATSSTHAQSYEGAWEASGKVCRSPVTGLVIKVNVKPGQTVAAGELMLVLEAMKMETNITAPHAATVKTVHVTPGDSVKMNQVLVECE
jgi:methylmalonyl-CoA carboxyltransferase 1.3S subunit